MQENQDFQELFEKAPIGLALCDMDGRLILVNQAYADILGRTTAETLKLEYWHITPIQYETEEGKRLAELQSPRGSYGPYEKYYIHKDGSLIPVRLNGRVVELRGRKLIWSSVERLEMPIHSVTLFQEAPIGLALCRMDGRLVAVNQAFADLIGYTREDALKSFCMQITQEPKQMADLKKSGRYGPYKGAFTHQNMSKVPVLLVGKLLPINGEDFIWSCCQKNEVEDAGDASFGGPALGPLVGTMLYTTNEPIRRPSEPDGANL